MRRGVCDLWRRAEVRALANARYLTALASTKDATPLATAAQPVCRARTVQGRRHRALNPWAPDDAKLLETISDGQWTLHGLRNRDLRHALYPETSDPKLRHRQAAAVTRKLTLLRAHGIIRKISRTHRWELSARGRTVVTALLAARHASIDELSRLAA